MELESTLLYEYSKPGNLFLLLYQNYLAIGCVCLKRWDEFSCELKRMFVMPEHRNKGLGSLLVKEGIKQAKLLGYRQMLLDTNAEMEAAVHLYKKQGFYICEPYCENENNNVIYFKKLL